MQKKGRESATRLPRGKSRRSIDRSIDRSAARDIKLNPDTELVTVERRTRKRSLGIDKIVSPGVIRFTTSNKSPPPRPCGRSPGFPVDSSPAAARSFHVIAGRCSVTRKRRYVNRSDALARFTWYTCLVILLLIGPPAGQLCSTRLHGELDLARFVVISFIMFHYLTQPVQT